MLVNVFLLCFNIVILHIRGIHYREIKEPITLLSIKRMEAHIMNKLQSVSRQAVVNVLSVAVENFNKPQVIDTLLRWHNDKSNHYKMYDDLIYINDDDNVNMIFNYADPAQVLRYTSRKYEHYDAYIMLDGYGCMFSFHYDYFIDTFIKDEHDLIDYIVEFISVHELNDLYALSLRDKNDILREAYNNEQ